MMHSYVASQRQFTFTSTCYLQCVPLHTCGNIPKGYNAFVTTAVGVILAFIKLLMATSYWCESTKEDNENSKVRLHHGVHSVERSKIVRHRLLWTFSL